jgi:hypothetical protein
MFGRMSFINGDPGRLDDLVDYVSWTVKSTKDRLPGSLGLAMWVDRPNGAALVMTLWADEDAMIESERSAGPLRDDGAAIIDGVSTVERYEALLVDAFRPHRAGNVMRMTRLCADPHDIERHATWTRESVVPVLRRVPGYLSYVVAVHRPTGRAITLATYHDDTDADIAYTATGPTRTAAVSRCITIDTVRHFEVALVGLRPPRLPQQRPISLPAASLSTASLSLPTDVPA